MTRRPQHRLQLDRLRTYTGEDRGIGSFEAGRIRDSVGRLHRALTAPATHAKTLAKVLQGLRRTEPPVNPPVAKTACAATCSRR
ncbi:hypothetical protein [Streptomyces sp. NBC_00454]|uniref:hypothetical protein n=1 Tax=Streptomyces sp. NBC_00454 TaxID=2975747 RepID=UPI0030DFC0D3